MINNRFLYIARDFLSGDIFVGGNNFFGLDCLSARGTCVKGAGNESAFIADICAGKTCTRGVYIDSIYAKGNSIWVASDRGVCVKISHARDRNPMPGDSYNCSWAYKSSESLI